MQKNDIYEIEITGMTDEGDGVGRINGFAVFVPYTIIGETVRIILIKVLKNYAVGKLIEVIIPSKSRTKSACADFYKCGGCKLWHMSYEEELLFKKKKVFDCLKRIGGFDNINIDDVVPSSKISRYRNKSQFPVTPEGIGMYAVHSHRLIEMNDCLISSEVNKPILESVNYWMKKFGIEAYDELSDSGLIRNIYTRTGKSGTLVCIVTNGQTLPRKKELIDEIINCGTTICGIVQNINIGKTNVLLGKEAKTLYGNAELTDNISDIEFSISPLSFYQINKPQTEKLYSLAREYADLKGHETVLDMYCGIGTIGQFMARSAGKIIGVEVVPQAIKDAKDNAKHNGIENAEYYCGKAESIIKQIVNSGEKPDIAILDPPRKGCDKKLLDVLSDIKSLNKIIYISCKPSTLARDLKYLNDKGFAPQKITPVDMFPRTPHVETVCLMSRVEGK